MKSLSKIATGAVLLLSLASLANAANCRHGFMNDPCARDYYSIVETEAFVRGHHNCMGVAHYAPWEVPQGYCDGYSKGKNTVPARSAVARVR